MMLLFNRTLIQKVILFSKKTFSGKGLINCIEKNRCLMLRHDKLELIVHSEVFFISFLILSSACHFDYFCLPFRRRRNLKCLMLQKDKLKVFDEIEFLSISF